MDGNTWLRLTSAAPLREKGRLDEPPRSARGSLRPDL